MLHTADYALALSAGLASLERTHIALYNAPIAALAQGLTAVAETLRLSELVDVESCLAADRTPLPTACTSLIQEYRGSLVSNTEAIRAIEASPGTCCTRPE